MSKGFRTHSMTKEETFLSGAERWHCHTCDRSIVIRWFPKPVSIVLQEGDSYAFHRCVRKIKVDNPQLISDELSQAIDQFFDEAGID